jgi:N-acyl-D-amino-acid deacylase
VDLWNVRRLVADIVVFDPETIEPRMPEVVTDLPAGAKRLKQYADGIKTTVVAGQPVLIDNEPTGALPGRILRGPLAARSNGRAAA